MSAPSPYADLPPEAFWRTGVVEAAAPFKGMYAPKVRLGPETRVMTAGSCFAQHISRALRGAGMALIDTEKPASSALSDALLTRYGYGMYSARYGNLYTARQLVQLLQEATGRRDPADPIWQRADGRHVDALRPAIEPAGFASPDEVEIMRAQHLSAVREAVAQADVLIFTLGLTETWLHGPSGTVYPTAPGTLAGALGAEHEFHDFSVFEVIEDVLAARALLRETRPELQIILTVSPVPLTATASGDHVAVASERSKAKLRAAAEELTRAHADIDYFPSFEMVRHPALKNAFMDNLRTPRPETVRQVIATFLSAHGIAPKDLPEAEEEEEDVFCEEALLEAFAT